MAEAEIREMLKTLAESNAELKRELLEVRQREEHRDEVEARLRREIEEMRNTPTDDRRGDPTIVSGAPHNDVGSGDTFNVGGATSVNPSIIEIAQAIALAIGSRGDPAIDRQNEKKEK